MSNANNVFPTDRQICRAVLNSLAQHPAVTNSNIFYPALLSGEYPLEPIRIQKYRLFGGVELLEPGLTLAVYPLHTSLDNIRGTIRHAPTNTSIRYNDKSLYSSMGLANNDTYSAHGNITLVIQLYLLEPTFSVPIIMNVDKLSSSDLTDRLPYGRQFQLTNDGSDDLVRTLEDREPNVVDHTTIEVEVIPAEEILRDWITLLRGVVRDMRVFRPFALRYPTIISVDYPTSNYIQKANLVFHTAYILIEFDLTETGLSNYKYPKPEQFIFET